MKIVIVNQPMGNRGDESAHRALIRNLSYSYTDAIIEVLNLGMSQNLIDDFKEVRLNVRYTRINEVKGYQKILLWAFKYKMEGLLSLHPTTKLIKRKIKSADLIICAPGGICMGGFQNWNHILILKIAKMLCKPIAYFARSIGPFPEDNDSQRLFKKYSLELMNYFGYFSLRDSKSVTLAKSLGINCVSTVDTAFLDSPKVVIPLRIKKMLNNSKYMVFVPHLLTWHYSYKNVSKELLNIFFIGIIKEILKNDPMIKIVMLPQVHYFARTDDKYYFTELMETVGDVRIEVIDDMYGSDIQQSIIEGSEYVIGARYHSIVFAINNAKPFISLSYEHKMSGLLNTLNSVNNIINIEDAFGDVNTVNDTIKKVSNMIRHIYENKNEYVNNQILAKKISKNGYNEMTKYINSII